MAWIPRTWLLGAAALPLLVACARQQELYGQLSQRQANEMVAVLRNEGIAAEKEAHDGHVFSVLAPRESFARAVEVLRASGQPREGYDTLGQVFKKEGFVSSPLEERARLMHALSQEIANTISSIDGVVVARVHLSVPDKDPLADKRPPAAASVFIKHRAGVALAGQVGHIKALVVNSIQGLAYENVTVVLFPADPVAAPAGPAAPPQALPGEPSLGGVDTLMLAVAALGAATVAAGGLAWGWQRHRARRRDGGSAGQAAAVTVLPGLLPARGAGEDKGPPVDLTYKMSGQAGAPGPVRPQAGGGAAALAATGLGWLMQGGRRNGRR
jgi:type III secretion protein J